MKRIILSAAVLLAANALTFASNPKGNTSETKSNTKTQLNVYYVTGESGSNYTLSTSPNPSCGDGDDRPCEITSENPLGSSVSKTQVDTQSGGIHIENRQPEF
jgi:hypothetical protein